MGVKILGAGQLLVGFQMSVELDNPTPTQFPGPLIGRKILLGSPCELVKDLISDEW